MSKNKITYDAIDELFEFLNGLKKEKIQQKYIDKVKQHFCYDMEKIKNLVYWSFNIEDFCRGDDQFREGLITIEQYEFLLKHNKKDIGFGFGEITKHCDLTLEIDEITFSKDMKQILQFLERNVTDDELMEYFYCINRDCRKCEICNDVIEKGDHIRFPFNYRYEYKWETKLSTKQSDSDADSETDSD